MSNIRHNGIVGVIEYAIDKAIHFSEYENGEGLDFVLSEGDKDRYISLSIDDILTLAVACHAAGYLSLKEVKKESKKLQYDSKTRQERIDNIRKAVVNDPENNPPKCACGMCNNF